MPGAAYFEMAAAAAHTSLRLAEPAVALTAAAIATPLRLPAAAQGGSVIVSAEVALGSGDVTIRSAPAGSSKAGSKAAGEEATHLRGTLMLVAASGSGVACSSAEATPSLSADAVRAACQQPSDTDAVYRGLHAAGLQYGPAFRQLHGIQQGDSSAAATLGSGGSSLQAQQDAGVSGFLLHPTLLDSCLQLGALVSKPAGPAGSSAADSAFVPASLAVFLIQRSLQQGSAAAAVVRRSPEAQRKAAAATYRDHVLLAGTGAVLAVLDGLEAKELHASSSRAAAATAAAVAGKQQQPSELLYEVAWQAASAAAAVESIVGPDAVAQALPSSSTPLAALSGGLLVLQSALQKQAAVVQLQTVADTAPGAIATSGAASFSLSGNALWGMLRSFAAEAPAVSHGGVRADPLAANNAGGSSTAVSRNASSKTSDGYGSLQQGGAALHAALLPSSHVRAAQAPHHLVPRPRGAFRNLAPQSVPVGTAETGWVEVEVEAVGINFRCAGFHCVHGLPAG